MFILKSILTPLQTEFKKDADHGKLFISILLGILFPVSGSCNSQLLRVIHSIFGLKITARRLSAQSTKEVAQFICDFIREVAKCLSP